MVNRSMCLDDDGREMLDGMAGRQVSVLGALIHESLIASFAEYLGDGSCFANVAGHHLLHFPAVRDAVLQIVFGFC